MSLSKLLSLTGFLVLFFVGTIYGIGGVTSIEPGEVGIKVKNLGANRGMQEDTIGTGMHWVDPIVYDVVVYDTRRKQYDLTDVPSDTRDGQKVHIDLSIDLGLDDQGVPSLHEEVGQRYYEQIVYPRVRTALRDATSRLQSDEIYTGSGRGEIQSDIRNKLKESFSALGIIIEPNLRAIKFQNVDFVTTLETKAKRAQQVVIAKREAAAAKEQAIKTKNDAEGQKFARIQAAEADKEERRLKGEGDRLQKEEEAAGNLAIAKAEAEGIRLKNEALAGSGGANIVALEWARQMGPNVKVLGYPLGAPGTNGLFMPDGILGQALKAPVLAQ